MAHSLLLRALPFLGRYFFLIFLWVEDWVLPPVCLHCGLRRRGALPLCRVCLRILRDSRPEDDEVVSGMPWIRALFRLTPPLHDLIHGFKYRHQRRHIGFLTTWMRWRRAWVDDLAHTYDALLPVPLHPARRRDRGYNQAEALARELARYTSRELPQGRVPVIVKGLKRVRHTGTQTRLKGEARAGNLDGAFRAVPRHITGKRILLIDDVCTTGSTLAHCRDELLRAGAARVDALTLAWVEKKVEPKPGEGFETAAGFFS